MPIIDLHQDILIAERAGSTATRNQTGFEKIAESEVRIVLGTGFADVTDFFDPAANVLFETDLEEYISLCEKDKRFKLITSRSDITPLLSEAAQHGILFHIEGLNAVTNKDEMSSLLGKLYKKGLRSIGPLWIHKNAFGGGTSDPSSALSELGALLIEWCEYNGVIFDLAHMNYSTLAGALALIRKPPFLSHSACHAIVPNVRNITDEQLKEIGEKDGVVGIFLASKYAAAGDAFSSAEVTDHILHAIDTAGEDHVALGTDLGGITSAVPADVRTPKELPNILDALSKSAPHIALEKIAYRNSQRVLEAHLK